MERGSYRWVSTEVLFKEMIFVCVEMLRKLFFKYSAECMSKSSGLEAVHPHPGK